MEQKIKDFISNINLLKFEKTAYIYNLDILESNIKNIYKKISLLGNIKIYFACKANQNFEILTFLRDKIDGIDIASIQEFNKVFDYGFTNISATGPSFIKDEIETLYLNNVSFDFNSIDQLINSIEVVEGKQIGVRLQFEEDSRFGLDLIEDGEYLSRVIKDFTLTLNRIHIHSESENYNEWEIYLYKIVDRLKELNLYENIKIINIGGGWKKSLFSKELTEFKKIIFLIVQLFNSKKNLEIIIEPGNALINECGFLITEVISVDKGTVILSTSQHNNNKWYRPIPLTTNSINNKKEIYNFYGNTCYEYDCFAKDVNFPKLSIGDKIIFYKVGAYSKSNHSNLHLLPFPKEIYYYKGKFIDE